jgi:hypothetical protein
MRSPRTTASTAATPGTSPAATASSSRSPPAATPPTLRLTASAPRPRPTSGATTSRWAPAADLQGPAQGFLHHYIFAATVLRPVVRSMTGSADTCVAASRSSPTAARRTASPRCPLSPPPRPRSARPSSTAPRRAPRATGAPPPPSHSATLPGRSAAPTRHTSMRMGFHQPRHLPARHWPSCWPGVHTLRACSLRVCSLRACLLHVCPLWPCPHHQMHT